LPRRERESLGNVEELILQTPSGSQMPLGRIAKVTAGQAYTTIKRYNGKRDIRVKADVIEGEANPAEVIEAANASFIPGLLAKYPGLSHARAGAQKEEQEFIQHVKKMREEGKDLFGKEVEVEGSKQVSYQDLYGAPAPAGHDSKGSGVPESTLPSAGLGTPIDSGAHITEQTLNGPGAED